METHGHGDGRLLEPGQLLKRLREDGERGQHAGARLREVGHVVCQGGDWEGRQLISREWIEESTRADTNTDPSLDYQYFWWVNKPDGKHHISARGMYGQYIYVAPEKDLVIVRLGKEEGERGYGYWINLFEELATKLDMSAKELR